MEIEINHVPPLIFAFSVYRNAKSPKERNFVDFHRYSSMISFFSFFFFFIYRASDVSSSVSIFLPFQRYLSKTSTYFTGISFQKSFEILILLEMKGIDCTREEKKEG